MSGAVFVMPTVNSMDTGSINEEKLDELLYQRLTKDKKYLLLVEAEVINMDKGLLEFRLRVHNGKVTDFVVSKVKRIVL